MSAARAFQCASQLFARTRVESIRAKIAENAVNMDVDLESVVITPPDGGGPGALVTVRSAFAYEFGTPVIKSIFPGGRYDFSVSTSMKNEPFF